MAFNNCNCNTNGEKHFYEKIKDDIDVIFDIGCRNDTLFTNFQGQVHYFDPVKEFIDKLSVKPNNNRESYFNNFGLSDENGEQFYYPKYQSFFDRVNSCGVSDNANKVVLKLRKAKDYIAENGVTSIDFVKIDTEGYELKVIQGFEDEIDKVKIVQFEYGGTFKDSGSKLIDVIKYLEQHNFHNFNYLINGGMTPITDFEDHYQYCNIVCFNKNS